MSETKLAVFSVSSAWIAVVIILVLAITLGGGPFWVFLAFVSMSALALTGYWARKMSDTD